MKLEIICQDEMIECKMVKISLYDQHCTPDSRTNQERRLKWAPSFLRYNVKLHLSTYEVKPEHAIYTHCVYASLAPPPYIINVTYSRPSTIPTCPPSSCVCVSLVSPPHVLTVRTHTLKTETLQLIKSRDKSALTVNGLKCREITVVSDFARLLRTFVWFL